MLLRLETCLFANRGNSNACIMVLQKLTFVVLCAPFLSPLPHIDDDLKVLLLQCKTWVNEKLAGAFLYFSLLELYSKGSQSVLEAKCTCSYIHPLLNGSYCVITKCNMAHSLLNVGITFTISV